ncbi:MAG TPA: hypothetical protein VGS13_13915 [Stellaceae bacterium]|nr:hypothetical protein [Stellaceae bacterium]
MQPFPHHKDRSEKPFAERLDRAFADINAFLLALAIGLAVLDIACFTAISSIVAIKPLLQTTQTAPLSGRVVVAAGDAPGR